MPNVIREGDQAVGHTDIEGSSVVGVVQAASCSQTVRNGGKKIATSSTYVNFASHAHDLDGESNPIDYRSHSVLITATGKNKASGGNIAVDGDVVNVSDEAGTDAVLQATTTNLSCVT